jgi:hypothetical protein
VTRETLQRVWKEIDRLIAETQSSTYEAVMTNARIALRSPAFCAFFLPALGKVLPGADQREQCERYIDQIETRQKFSDLMLSLKEPKSKELDRLRSIFRSIAPGLRDFLDGVKATVRPLGGPSEKLASHEKIVEIVDTINRVKLEEGEPLKDLFVRFAPDVGLQARTLRRKYEEEMRRRRSMRGNVAKS